MTSHLPQMTRTLFVFRTRIEQEKRETTRQGSILLQFQFIVATKTALKTALLIIASKFVSQSITILPRGILLSTWFTRVSLLAVDTRVVANEANDGVPQSEKVPIAERVTKWQKSWKILTIARAACNTMQRGLTMFPLIRSFRPWDHARFKFHFSLEGNGFSPNDSSFERMDQFLEEISIFGFWIFPRGILRN